jgi:hypothetical protein
MPERLFWTAIPTSWRKAFQGNSVTFDSPDNYLFFMEPKYDSLQYLQEPEPAVSTRHPSPVFTELAPSMLVHHLRSHLLLGRWLVRLSPRKPAVTTAVFVVLISAWIVPDQASAFFALYCSLSDNLTSCAAYFDVLAVP